MAKKGNKTNKNSLSNGKGKKPSRKQRNSNTVKSASMKYKKQIPHLDAYTAYAIALTRPCSAKAIGAVTPGPYSSAVMPYHIKRRTTIITDSFGAFDYIFFGHPTMMEWKSPNTVLDGGSTSYPSGGAVNVTYASTPAQMQNLFTAWRVVGNGVRLQNRMPVLSASGRLMITRLPMGPFMPGPNSLTTADWTDANFINKILSLALDVDDHIPTSIINSPACKEYVASEILSKSFDIANISMSEDHKTWHMSSNSNVIGGATDRTVEGASVDNSAGVIDNNKSDTIAYGRSGGWTAILIRGTGFPINAPVIDVHNSVHIEGTPQFSGEEGSIVPSASSTAGPASSDGFMQWARSITTQVVKDTNLVGEMKKRVASLLTNQVNGMLTLQN